MYPRLRGCVTSDFGRLVFQSPWTNLLEILGPNRGRLDLNWFKISAQNLSPNLSNTSPKSKRYCRGWVRDIKLKFKI